MYTIDASRADLKATPDDDSDDDAVAINRIVASLPPTGGAIFLPRGSYLLKSRILLRDKDNISFVGEGKSTLIRVRPDTGKYAFSDFPLVEVSACRNLEFRDIAFSGQNKAYNGNDSVQTPAIYLTDNSEFCRVSNCEFRDLNSGIRIENSSDCRISDNVFRGNIVQDGVQIMLNSFRNVVSGNTIRFSDSAKSGMGIRISGFPGQPAKSNSIVGNTILNAKDEGIVAEFGESNTIVGNTVSNCAYGIQLYAHRYGTISANTVENCRLSGIGLFSNEPGRIITGNIISGNSVRNSGTAPLCHAITISSSKEGSADSNILADNFIQGGATNGIDISARHCLIRGNFIQSPGQMGICIANASYCVVEGNSIQQPGRHGIFGKACHSIVSGNLIVAKGAPAPGSIGLWLTENEDAVVANNLISGFPVNELGVKK